MTDNSPNGATTATSGGGAKPPAYATIAPADLGASSWYKVLVYGDSGVGKTFSLATAPDPLVLVTEANAIPTLRAAFKAHRHEHGEVVHAKGTGAMATVRAVLNDARSGNLQRRGYRTLCLDGLTDIQRILKAEMQGGNTEFSLQQWGILTDRMRAMFGMLRDLEIHVVCTTLCDYEKDESTGKRYAGPLFQGQKLGPEVPGYFNVVAYLTKRAPEAAAATAAERWGANVEQAKSTGKVDRVALLDAPDGIISKGCGALGGTQPTNIAEWFRIMDDAPVVEPAAEQPPAKKPNGKRAATTANTLETQPNATETRS